MFSSPLLTAFRNLTDRPVAVLDASADFSYQRLLFALVLASVVVASSVAAFGIIRARPVSEIQREKALLKDYGKALPWPVFLFGTWLFGASYKLRQYTAPPPLSLFEMLQGFMKSQVVYAVTELGIADELAGGPKTADELALAVGAQSGRLLRLLRSAVQLGLFRAERPPGGAPIFRNNPMSAVLRRDHPNSQWAMVKHQIEDNAPSFDNLVWCVKTGGKAFNKAHGASQFDFFEAHPDREHNFSQAMTAVDSLGVQPVLEDYRWGKYRRYIDVAGAYGSFLARLLRKYPAAQGILFDQPKVIERAKGKWQDETQYDGLRDRTQFVAGSFFEEGSLPAAQDGDCYFLRFILHDWDDADCQRILTRLREALGTVKATLVLVEAVIVDEWDDPLFQRSLLDLHMLTAQDAAERTSQEWRQLLLAGGFKMTKVVRTRGVMSVVEAVPM